MPGEEVGDYRLRLQGNGNDGCQPAHQLWKSIVEVHVNQFPRSVVTRWTPLYQELLLRLEQTPQHLGLAVTFEDVVTMKRAAKAMSAWFRDNHGVGVVHTNTTVLHDGTPILYVRRGENWSRRGPTLATSDDDPLPPPPPADDPPGRRRGRPRGSRNRRS